MLQDVEVRILDPAIIESARRSKFLVQQRGEAFIRIRLRIIVGLHPVCIRIAKGIAVHGEEEFRLLMCRRSIHTRLQFAGSRTARIRDVHIVRPRHDDMRPRLGQEVTRTQGDGKGDILFACARWTDRPRITASMPGINDHRMPHDRLAECISAIRKDLNHEPLGVLLTSRPRDSIHAIGIRTAKIMPCIDSQCCTMILARNNDKPLQHRSIESDLMGKMLIQRNILQLDQQLIVRMIAL